MARKKKQRTPKNSEGRMTLGDHLIELRNRLVIVAITVVLFSVAGWWLYYPVYELLAVPFRELRITGYNVQINIGGVGGSFETHLRLAAYIGVALSIPMIMLQAWLFIMPGLHAQERKYALGYVLAAFPLFLTGILGGYYAITRAIPILMTFGPNKDVYQLVEFRDYIELVVKTCMIFGIAFIYPVFLVGLNMVGMLPVKKMIKGWRWAIFLSFVFTAVMVPTPEPITLFLVTSPFILLFFGAVGVSYVFERRRERKRVKEQGALSVDEASQIDDAPAPIELPSSIDSHYSEDR
ncbi:MAG: twin-arginine translocase subunit TatC [Dermabacter sp.]|nr:twin-arginine translocase subunit TatC [Dermabacter sp.]